MFGQNSSENGYSTPVFEFVICHIHSCILTFEKVSEFLCGNAVLEDFLLSNNYY